MDLNETKINAVAAFARHQEMRDIQKTGQGDLISVFAVLFTNRFH